MGHTVFYASIFDASVRRAVKSMDHIGKHAMPRPSSNTLHKPLTAPDITAFAALLEDLSERTEQGLSLEHVDGFITALLCGPREIPPAEYFPVLFGEANTAIFREPHEQAQFMSLFQRRWHQIAQALAAPIETLNDPAALEPLIMDWDGLLEELPPGERAELEADGLPEFASVWAAGFLQVLDAWEADWTLPVDSKDEAFVDEMLDPFFVLITPPEDWTPDERALPREDYVAMAIWSAYELRDFWHDRGCTSTRTSISASAAATRNAPCPCGSGKPFKHCCGAAENLH